MTEREPTLSEDVLVRGWVYVYNKQALAHVESRIAEEETFIKRIQYEQEIFSRAAQKVEDLGTKTALTEMMTTNEGVLKIAELRLGDLYTDAKRYRAVVAEIEADLGELAAEYEALLNELEVEIGEGIGEQGEQADTDEWGLFEEDEFLYDPIPADAPIPFADDDFPDDTEDFLADMKEIEG